MYDLAWRIVNERRSEAMKCVSVAQFQQNSCCVTYRDIDIWIRQRRLLLCCGGCRRCRKKHLQKVFEFIIVNMRNCESTNGLRAPLRTSFVWVWMRTLNITMKNKMKLNERLSERKVEKKNICMQMRIGSSDECPAVSMCACEHLPES